MKFWKRFTDGLLISCVSLIAACVSSAVLAAPAMELELPLTVNAAYSGDINAAIATESLAGETQSKVKVDRVRLHDLLKTFADIEQLTEWNLAETELSGWITLDELRNSGLEIWFDSSALTLNSKVPRLGTQNVSVRGGRKPELEEHYSQSRFASGLTVYARNNYNHMASRGQKKGFGDLSVDLTGFVSFGGFGGWSLFYQGEYQQGDEQPFKRKDVTLVHDDFKRGLRYSLGDVRPSTSRFQSSADMLGVSIERNYSDINPFRNLKPSGRSDFTLERESRVQFEVNGVIVDSQDLLPGTYSINDFPLAIGANDVRVWVDDGISRTEVSNFSTYVDTTLLAKGITNFGTSLGVLRERGGNGSRRYSDDVGVMGFYERGLTDNLTLGAQAEISESHGLFATSAIFGSPIGIFAAEAAASKRDGHDAGTAGLLRYFYSGVTNSNWQVQTDLQASYRSDSFMSMAEVVVRPEEQALNARTSFGKNGLSLSLSGELRTVNEIDSTRLSATLSKSFDGFSVSLGYQHLDSERNGGESDDKVSLTISKRLKSSSLRGQYKSANREYRAEWRKNSSRNVGDIRSRVLAISDLDSNDAELEVGYVGNRYELDVRHSTSLNRIDESADSSRTNLTMAGSVGYADGRIAFGRPFTDGFVIVDRHRNLRGKKISIARNSSNGAAVTSTKAFNTALIPLTSSYRSQRYLFAVEDLPVGYDLGSGDVNIYPGNLSGYRYKLGSDAANTVLGKVFSPAGEPLSLISGKILPLGKNNSEQNETIVFTNRTGRFVAEKMRLGKYQLVFGEKDEWVGELEVVEGDEPGLVLVGDIQLKEREQ